MKRAGMDRQGAAAARADAGVPYTATTDHVLAPPRHALTWRRGTGALWRYTGDGMVLLSVAGGNPLALDAAGAVVWEELGNPATIADLVVRTTQRLDVDAETVLPGLQMVVSVLAEAGLVSCDG